MKITIVTGLPAERYMDINAAHVMFRLISLQANKDVVFIPCIPFNFSTYFYSR